MCHNLSGILNIQVVKVGAQILLNRLTHDKTANMTIHCVQGLGLGGPELPISDAELNTSSNRDTLGILASHKVH